MKKFTDEQIIKALECCSTDVRENTCPKSALLLKKKCKDINIPRKIIKSKAIGVMMIELGKKEIKKTRSSDS